MRIIACLTILLICCGPPSTAQAHTQSTSRITLATVDGVPQTLAIEVTLIDLLHWIDLDSNADSRLTWGEVLSSRPTIVALITDNIRIAAGDQSCQYVTKDNALSFVRVAEASGLRVALQLNCPTGSPALDYRLSDQLFFDGDPTHRTLLRLTGNGNDIAQVLTHDKRELSLDSGASKFSGARSFVVEGFRHILSGYDHLVFLLLLILPAAGSGSMRTRLIRISAIVTAFTVAHSITLTAAILDVVHLPARPIEIAIAASVVVAALMNVVRPLNALGWKIAFTFGLLHGFGFAGALAELNLAPQALWKGLLAFNLGIELGQLAVVALLLPVLGFISQSGRYQSQMVPAASFACAVLGVVWTVARF